MSQTLIIVAVIIIGLPALWLTHGLLDKCCVRHARKYCKNHGLEISRLRWQPAFDKSGVKTEYTLVQLDCVDAQKQRRLVLLLTSPFKVRRLLNDEAYPETYDVQWPGN